jgi:cardiolipin synthase A/B
VHRDPPLIKQLRRWKWWLVALAALLAGGAALVVLLSRSDKATAAFALRGSVPSDAEGFGAALFQTLGTRLRPGHQVTLLQNGQVFDELTSRIAEAKHSVHVLMYIWEQGKASDRVVAALVARARTGVRCRILVDDLGSPEFAKTVQPALVAAGCEVRIFRPLGAEEKLARNHRKLVVVDGRLAITGGFGIRDNWLGDGKHPDQWRDSSVLFLGPSVADAQRAFAENWQEAGGGLLAPAAFPEPENGGPSAAAFVASSKGVVTAAERLTQLLLLRAQRRIWIANAYFVPSAAIVDILERKARAGVDVRILVPDKNSDSKTAFGAQHLEFGRLREAKARIWQYTASMMHAKVTLVDDDLLLVGSINLDPLSLNVLEEASLLTQDAKVAAEAAGHFVDDCTRAEVVAD